MKPLILISSGDADFYLLLSHILEADGFNTILAGGIEETLHLVMEKEPQAIVLDCRPGVFSGADVCTRLKQNPQTFSITTVALIGPGAESQFVDLLKAGVDESFVRPIAPVKLLDFLQTMLANTEPILNGVDVRRNCLNYADIVMNLNTRRVRRNGIEIHLGPIEFKLLRHFLQTPEQVFSRDELISAAWPDNIYVEARTVDVHMGRLRKTLKREAGTDVIRTVRAAGYALELQIQ